ncbi:hypothetical protein FOZ61_001457 [Perkinsus olseni]|uniref:Uncharacterized protein n=1 Tax=Perkinsus olseni TaxID=32597 RepID=A0A7J6LWZ7_PEROL|nr:hypothetical protein FOZ61_001457 [Perkinsus olseni]
MRMVWYWFIINLGEAANSLFMMSLPYPFSATAAGPTTVSPLAFIIPSLLYVTALGTFVHAPLTDNLILHLASLEKLWNVFSIILGLLFGFYTTVSFSRWWSVRTLTGHAAGRSIDITVILTGEGMAQHVDLYRLLLLGYAVHLIEMAGGRGEDRVETLEAMGLLRKNDGLARPLSVPAVYSSFLRCLAAIDDVPMHVRLSVQADLTVCRGSAGDAMMFLSTPVPPTLSWIVHGGTWAFLLFMPFGGFDLHKYWLNTVATIESLVGQSIIEHPQGDESKPRRSSRRRGLQDKKNA